MDNEIRAEREEQLNNRLLKVCSLDELENFREYTEDNNWELYWNDGWINLKTRKLISIERLYGMYKKAPQQRGKKIN